MAVFTSGQTTPPKRFDDTFSANSWNDIILACQMNLVPTSWNVGDSKPIVVEGVTYQIDIIGKNHDAYSDGTGLAPLTLQFHECYETTQRMNGSNTNTGGWMTSEMRLTTIPTVFDALPIDVRSGIRQVNKPTTIGGQQNTVNLAQDNLFLLSEVEVFGDSPFSRGGEGVQYEYYAKGLSPIKTRKGTDSIWWLRSPYSLGTGQFCRVSATGEANWVNATTTSYIAPAFCF